MAKKPNLTIEEDLVNLIQKIPNVTDKKGNVKYTHGTKFFKALEDSMGKKSTPSLIAISSKTNKVLTLEEVEELEKEVVRAGKVSAEEYILVEVERAMPVLAQGITDEKQRQLIEQDLKSKSRAWTNWSAMSTRVSGRAGKSLYSTNIKDIANDYIINLGFNTRLKLSEEAAKTIIINHQKNLGPRTGGAGSTQRFAIVFGRKVKYLYVKKVSAPPAREENGNIISGKNYDPETWDFSKFDLIGPFDNYILKKYAESKDIAHFLYADETINLLGVLEWLKKARKIIVENKGDTTKIDQLLQIADQSISGAVAATSILGGNLPNRPSIPAPLLQSLNSGVKVLANGDVVIPVITEDKVTFNPTTSSITIVANTWAANLITRNDSKFLGTLSSSLFNQGGQRALEESERAPLLKALAQLKTSNSMISTLLTNSLGQIFNNKKLLRAAKQHAPKNKSGKKWNSVIGKVGNKINTTVPKFRVSKLRKAMPELEAVPNVGIPYKGVVSITESSVTNLELLAIINANLRQEVIAQMKYPALVNRTGRFAGSVRAIDIVNSQINATFMKSPYSVFMQQGGKTPWNTTDRDPVKIINEAISSISSKYNLGISKVHVR
jgi:hypothetical protein